MIKFYALLAALFFLPGCKSQQNLGQPFVDEISDLQDYFHIPGIACIVVENDTTKVEAYMGYSDIVKETPIDSSTVIPMASLTKIFTGYLVAQLSGSSASILNLPINLYVTKENIPDSILVKHVISHTSEGNVGKHFHYSNRFSWLTQVVASGHRAPYEAALNTNITQTYEMNNTFLLSNEKQLTNRKIAKPYVYEGETKPGFIDYGFSASSGITSTVRDLVKFSKMIRYTPLITDRAPFEKYNWGLFGQKIQGVEVLWAYGQYDCYSSLFIMVPEKNLTFIIAGNNSLISDPPRMIYGDITTSLFALSFFKHYLKMELPNEWLKAKALAGSYMGRFDDSEIAKSKELLREVFKKDNNYNSLATMHTISQLKEISAENNKTEFTEFDTQLESIGKTLLKDDVNDPYANIYMANYFDSRNESDSARVYYRRVANAKNFSPGWYTKEAQEWLKQNASTSTEGIITRPRE